MTIGGIFKKGMVMLQSNSLTFLNVPKFLQRKDIDNCVSLFSNQFMSCKIVSIFSKQAAIRALDIFKIIKELSLNVFKFVKEFEQKNKACFFVLLTCLLKNNFHCSNNLPNCQERKELIATNKRQPNIDDYHDRSLELADKLTS